MSDVPGTQKVADIDVRRRLEQLRGWQQEWEAEDLRLLTRLRQLSPNNHMDMQTGVQIAGERRRQRFRLIQAPIEISEELVVNEGFGGIRQRLADDFLRLKQDERILWLNNLFFVMTPDLRKLLDKIARIRSYRSSGQRRNFLLGGLSGMGKTTSIDWLNWTNGPVVEAERNRVPIIRFDAPVNNRSSKALFQRAILACGANYLKNDDEEFLLNKLVFLLEACGVEVLCVDEIEHLVTPFLRRHLLELSNRSTGVCIICASCTPFKFTRGDTEIAGRWNDQFDLEPYTGKQLDSLLAFVELLLPFSKPSRLALRVAGSRSGAKESPADLIETWTHGVLRDIMILLITASAMAIRAGAPQLSADILAKAQTDITTKNLADVADALGLPKVLAQ